MSSQKVFHLLLFFGAGLSMLAVLLFFEQGKLPLLSTNHYTHQINTLSDLHIAQNTNTYLGPNQKTPGNAQLIRVQVLVYNDPNPNGVRIVSAAFDGKEIPIKPRDIYGFRGQASFQKKPGKYKLSWEVEKDKQNWPRTVEHEQEVTIDARDLWIQITITGDTAEIS